MGPGCLVALDLTVQGPADVTRARMTHLQGDLVAHGRRLAEPAGRAAEEGVPALIDGARGRRPGPLLAQAVEAVRCLRVQADAVVVPEQALDLQPVAMSQPAIMASLQQTSCEDAGPAVVPRNISLPR